jgi:hypothetical protein
MLHFRDVLVTPYTELLDNPRGGEYHQGGPHWPDWPCQTAARYCDAGKPYDTEPLHAEPTATLIGPVAWGGAVFAHFGHQIADFTTRLLPSLDEKPDLQFAFSARENFCDQYSSWENIPAFFPQILGWYGIPADRVHLIMEPTVVERLVVSPQAEQVHGPGPEPWYLDLLDANTRSRLGEVERDGSLYVSRANQLGHFAGEAYIEKVFKDVGFRVLRPETVSIKEQLRAYTSAESIVFAEGSALHGLQLIGRVGANVTVLNRRAGLKVAEPLIRPRAGSLRYIDAVRGLLHSLDLGGKPATYYGVTILDPQRLLTELPIGTAWDENAFNQQVEMDIQEWLDKEGASPRWKVPGSPEFVAENIRAAGLDHFITIPPIASR